MQTNVIKKPLQEMKNNTPQRWTFTIAGERVTFGSNASPSTPGGTPEQMKKALRGLSKVNYIDIDAASHE